MAARLAEADVDDAEGRHGWPTTRSIHARAGRRTSERPPGRPMAEPVRIQKALADAGVASRRAADALVVEGRVIGERRAGHDRASASTPRCDVLAVDGRPIAASGRRTLPRHAQAGRRHQHGPRPPCRAHGARPPARRMCGCAARASTRWVASTRTPRACCCSPTTATGRSACCTRATAWNASTPSACREPLTREQAAGAARGIELDEGLARLVSAAPRDPHGDAAGRGRAQAATRGR